MIVVGAGGFAKELIDVLITGDQFSKEELFFFDEINKSKHTFYGFNVIHSMEDVTQIFNDTSNEFCLGIGKPKTRYTLCNRFEQVGGKMRSVISVKSIIGNFDVETEDGSCIMNNSSVSNGTRIGKGTLINTDVMVAHDVKIGDFCDIAPGSKISGYCQIGNYVTISTGAIILPRIEIGENSFIGAGSVVSSNVPDNSVVVGVLPSRVVNRLPDFEL